MNQEFRADLHIHSRFSRATSRALNLPLLAGWAALKGLAVLGTGDFTHPEWRAEMRELLELEESSGLYRLKDPALAAQTLPDWAESPLLLERAARVRFLLQAEISSIYKRGGRVRKVHNLIYMPDLETADKFSQKLAEVGNLASDGRPILGLDSEHLLEMTLGYPESHLVPAHIWTPWFSLFGSKSGFDSLEECFGSLSPHIFALETGLSSDPEMNRRISALDGRKLISNSDAHSGENLAREANIFSGEISYAGIFEALRAPATPEGHEAAPSTRFLGTCEFFPDEGKYHLDGHRACNVALSPEETRELGGLCPVCGKPLTVGVLYRVQELADRPEPVYRPDESFKSLIPLPEIIGEVLSTGSKSRKVGELYRKLLDGLGPELDILLEVPPAEIAKHSAPLAEGVTRMREGRVFRQGGYDGEYGVISVFTPEERRELKARGGVSRGKAGSALLPGLTPAEAPTRRQGKKTGAAAPPAPKDSPIASPNAAPGASPEAPADTSPDASPNASAGTSMDASAEAFRPLVAGQAHPAGAGSSPLPGEVSACGAGASAEPRLNGRQQKAVQAEGPVLAIAGPGTGKTHTLAARVRRLVAEGVPPRRILALTFTRRAARELDERLNSLLSGLPAAAGPAPGETGKPHLPRTDTLHALAFEFWHRVQGQSPVLLNEDAAFRVFSEASCEESASSRKTAWNAINLAREKREPLAPELQGFFDRYSTHKDAWNLADYTDLLEFWLTQARTGQYPPVWQHVLVDEIQDLSPLQLELVEAISPADGEGFFGIGDPNQSIYGFRGAHGRVEEFFKGIWPRTKTIHLQENYRSGLPVIKLAQTVFDDLPGVEELRPMSPAPAEIHYFEANSAESEATWVAGQIRQLLGATSHSLLDAAPSPAEPYSPGDIAILMRGRVMMQPIRRALERAGLPVSQPSADPFWHEPRVIKILQVVGRMLGISVPLPDPGRENRPTVPECPDRVLTRGPASMAAYWGKSEPFDARFWQSKEFKDLSAAFETHQGWDGLLNWLSLQNELELVRQKSEKIQLITMHASKGLEFRAVFLPGLEEGIMPFAGREFLNGQPPGPLDLDEEKRVFYVAVTRAKEGLYLSRAEKRHIYARELRLPASRFLRKLPKDMVRHSRMVARTTSHEQQLKLI